jgi:hypothetical protein
MAPTIRGLRCRVGHLFQSNDQDITDERHRLVSLYGYSKCVDSCYESWIFRRLWYV